MLKMIVVPNRLVFKSKENDFKIYKVNIIDENSNILSIDETILGEVYDLIIDVEYIIEAEKEVNNIFGTQYRIKNVYKVDYSKKDEELLFANLFGKRLLNKVIRFIEYPITDFLKKDFEFDKIGISEKSYKDMKIKIIANKIYIDSICKFKEINISFKLAKKIIDKYGYNAVEKVKKNPYILYKDINGIGFIKADQIARNLGIKGNDKNRIDAAIHYVLEDNLNQSNTWIYIDYLYNELEKLLEITIDDLDNYIYKNEFYLNGDKISLRKIVLIEKGIIDNLNKIKNSFCRKLYKDEELEFGIKNNVEFKYSEKQIEFIKSLNTNNLVLLCGYAGTGKTASVKAVLDIYSSEFYNIKLCSPTAKAAKVLSESTGKKALTIHRLLGCKGKGKFFYNRTNKLPCDLLIIDEASMIDIYMFNHILNAVDNDCRVIIIGDIAQLESVQCGNVFYDLIKSREYNMVIYKEVYRQAKESGILTIANEVRKGNSYYFKELLKTKNHFETNEEGNVIGFINIKDNFNLFLNDKQNMMNKLLGNYKQSIEKYGVENVLVISPYKKGDLGVRNINESIKKIVNNKDGIEIKGVLFSIGDKVKHIKNDYEREQYDKKNYDITLNEYGVFNGDFGIIVDIQDEIIFVDYEDKIIKYEYPYNDLELAYAITCHSSQGSQADLVIGIMDISHYINLKRNLLYTMITRAKKNFILIVNSKALFIAINNNTSIKKQTYINDIINNKLII
jgi:RecD/TraA family predicted helicase